MQIEQSDIVGQSSVARTADGWEATRIFLVRGTDGDAASRPYLAAITAGVPQLGDPHPAIAGIQCVSVEARPQDDQATIFAVTCVYRVPSESETPGAADGAGVLTLGATTVSDPTYVDINGELIAVTMRNPELVNQDGTPETVIGTVTTVVQAEVDRPQVTVRVVRTEDNPPFDRLVRFVGKINRGRWSGFEAQTWLCRNIESEPVAGGRHKVTYEMVYDARTWRLRATINVSGIVPRNAILGNGIEYFDVYDTEDFDALGFTVAR